MALIKLNPVHKPRLPPILAEKNNFLVNNEISRQPTFDKSRDKKTAENVLKFPLICLL